MNQRVTATRFGFGLLGSLCLLLRPFVALVCCCCCNAEKTAHAEATPHCCDSATTTCCLTAEKPAEANQQATGQCCGSGTCCQQLPQFLAEDTGNRETSQQEWVGTTRTCSTDLLCEPATAVSLTGHTGDDPPPLHQRLAVLCVWRN